MCNKFHTKTGIEYDETISEVVKHLNFRAFLTSAVYYKVKVFQVCVKAEFVHSKLNNEELHMQQLGSFHGDEKKRQSPQTKTR